MAAEKLAAMAMQIADFFRPYPRDEAVAGIAEHIVAFWTPAMLAELRAHAESGASGLDPLVREALRAPAEPDAESPIKKEVAGPQEVGQLGSDAG